MRMATLLASMWDMMNNSKVRSVLIILLGIAFILAIGIFGKSNTAGSLIEEAGAINMDASESENVFNSMEGYLVVSSIPPYSPKYEYVNIPPEGKYVVLPVDTDPRTAGQCVLWITYTTEFKYSGDAKSWTAYIQGSVPREGAIVVMNAGYYGHIGEVVFVDYPRGKVYIKSRNWRGKYIVSVDEFAIDDSRLLGYIYE